MRHLQPPGWPQPKGYANGVEANGIVFTGGMIGWDETGAFPHTDLAGQAGQALRNIVAVLAEAGARPEGVVRLAWYITDRQEDLPPAQELREAYPAVMDRHIPAMA